MRLLLIALLLCGVCACTSADTPPPSNAVIPEDSPNEESWNSSLLLTDSTWTKARLLVGHVRKYQSKMETMLDSGVYIEFFDRTGRITATLTSDSAKVDDRTGDMAAFGSVQVNSSINHTHITTDHLDYDSQNRMLSSDAFVSIVDSARGRTLQGIGFESDDALQNYKIFKASGQSTGR